MLHVSGTNQCYVYVQHQRVWPLQASDEAEDDEDMGALAAFGCLQALSTVLDSVSRLPHLFPQLEDTLFPVMQAMCTEDGQDVFEEILEMISYFTYFSPEVTCCPSVTVLLWHVVENTLFLVMQAMCTRDGQDVFEEILEMISYFTYFSPEVTCCPSVTVLLWHVVENTLFPVMQAMCTEDGQDVFEEILEMISYFTYFSPKVICWPVVTFLSWHQNAVIGLSMASHNPRLSA